jgi:hypothetical protein
MRERGVAMAVMFCTEGLARSFGARRALDGVELEVAAGTVLGLLGLPARCSRRCPDPGLDRRPHRGVRALAVRQFRRLS